MDGVGLQTPVGSAEQATPQSRQAEADSMAQEIQVMEPTMRRSTLINLKKQDQTLHALVKQKLDELENQAGTAGKAMARQGQM